MRWQGGAAESECTAAAKEQRAVTMIGSVERRGEVEAAVAAQEEEGTRGRVEDRR